MSKPTRLDQVRVGDLVALAYKEHPTTIRPVTRRTAKQFYVGSGIFNLDGTWKMGTLYDSARLPTQEELDADAIVQERDRRMKIDLAVYRQREDVKLAERILSKDADALIAVGVEELRRFVALLDAASART